MSEEIFTRWQDPAIEKLQQENEQLQDRINKLEKENSVLMENLIRSKTKYNNDKARYRKKAKMYRDRINKALEILYNINEDLPLNLILTEIEHTEYVLKGDKE